MTISRRDFVAWTAAAGLGLSRTGAEASAAPPGAPASSARPLCVFSKHLQWLDYRELAEVAAEVGFDGVDLPVRPGGHVLPERVRDDLPRAVGALKEVGLRVPMITTAIDDARHPATEPILQTASSVGVQFYRLNWLSYHADRGLPESLEAHGVRLRELAALNQRLGIHGAYQNHAGVQVGGPVWDLWLLLRDFDPRWMGCQYDIRHATAEGGTSWPLGLRLLAPHIRTLDVKDFIWARDASGRWRIRDVPLGEGMVDFERFWKLVKELGISGPIALHFEYEPFHSTAAPAAPAAHRKLAVAAMRRDLTRLREMLDRAGLRS